MGIVLWLFLALSKTLFPNKLMMMMMMKSPQGISPTLLSSQRSWRLLEIEFHRSLPGIFLVYNASLCLKVRKLCGFVLKEAVAYGLGAKEGCSGMKWKNLSCGFWGRSISSKYLLPYTLRRSPTETPAPMGMFSAYTGLLTTPTKNLRKRCYKLASVKVTEQAEICHT